MAKTVRYYIDVDASGSVRGGQVAEKALANVDKQAGRTGVGAIAMGNIFADVASQMMSRLAVLPGQIFEIGTRSEETASKYNTVFGPSVESVNNFLDDFAVKAGLSNQEAQELTSRAGAIGQGFGYTQEESAKLSTQIAQLAGDLTSFNNVPIEQSSNAIITALSGEREALKSLGIVVSENDVQKQALTETGKKNAEQLTQQEKAAATLSLIYDRAGVAVGDLERTQDSAANTSRRVQAQLKNISEELATEFLPIMADGLEFLEEILDSEQFDAFMAGTKSAINNIVTGIDFLTSNTSAGVDAMWATWEWLIDNIATLFINLVTIAKNYVLSLPEIFWNGIEAIFQIFQSLEDYSKQTLKNILSGFVELGKAIFAALTDPLNAKAEIEAAFKNLLEIGKAQVDNFSDLGKDLGKTLYENFHDNAELLADGLIEYDNTAFTGVEFTTWSEAAKKRLEDGLKVDAPHIDMPVVSGPGAAPALDIPTPEDILIDVGEIDFSGFKPDWERLLFIPDGTIQTLNKNLEKIDLMPEASINQLQNKLATVQDLYKNSQSDAERERLRIVEDGISMQIQAREMGIDMDRLQLEEWAEEQAAYWGNLYNTASQYVNVFSEMRSQEAEKQINRIDAETKRRVDSINNQLKKEGLSEKEREKLIKERTKIEESGEQKKLSIKRETFEKEKRANIVMSIAQTALAVVEALPNIPLSVAVGILGALQTAVVAQQPNPYLEGGPVLERMPGGKTSPGMKMISINENGDPEYVVNAKSTRKFEPFLDLINYSPAEAEQILMNMGFNIQPLLSGGLTSEPLHDLQAGTISDPLNRLSEDGFSVAPMNALSGVNIDIPLLQEINSDSIAESVSSAIAEGFASLSVELSTDLDALIVAFEERQAERSRLGS